MKKVVFLMVIYFVSFDFSYAQENKEPSNIKTIQLKPLQANIFSTIVPLGTVLELSFDDLDAGQKEYSYKIQHMTYDWKPSSIQSNQYINGFQENTIYSVSNSFNTFQNYTHYSVKIPNENTSLTKSGNYLISILNEDGKIVFTRRFVLYENVATVGVFGFRSRNTATLNKQQTVHFSVNYPTLQVNNPNIEINVAILQNNNWQTAITDLKPQFYKSKQLLYKYSKKTNFWAGNEYLHFDNKNIRNSSVNIKNVKKKDIYHNYLYNYENKAVKNYTYNPDINGQFIVRNLEAANTNTEADYAMIHFSLSVDEKLNKEIYVYGAFNNFKLSEDNKMIYNQEQNLYTASILLKQGFYNYTYVAKNTDDTISNSEIRGNFSETENEYTVIAYYKPFGEFYHRVIGVGSIIFSGER